MLLAAAAGEGLPQIVVDIGLCLCLAGILAVISTRLRLPSVAAFLVAGVILGPVGTGLVSDRANIDTIAQLGLILLLFLIGLEIDLRELARSGRRLVAGGALAYPMAALVGTLVAQAAVLVGLGAGVLEGRYAALYVGFTVAASSTLLVVALFQQTFTLDTVAGRVALTLLVLEDLWAITVLALQPNLADPQPGPILLTLAGTVVLAVGAFMLARVVLPVGFAWIAKQPATVLVAALAWCFAVMLVGARLGPLAVGSSMAAFIAGVTLANLPFRAEIARQVSVVRDFFVTLFFVGLGMTVPLPDGPGALLTAVGIAVLVLLVRLLVLLPLLYGSGLDRRTASVVATKMAQISEFSLVIVYLGEQLGHVEPTFGAAVILAFVVTSVTTPWLFTHADTVADRLGPWLGRLGLRAPPSGAAVEADPVDLALLGIHRTGSSLLHEIAADSPELLARTRVVDLNVAIHPRIAELGVAVHYGNILSADALRHAGVDAARVVLCTIPDEVLAGGSSVDVVRAARAVNAHGTVIATATTFREADRLREAGADHVLLPRLDAARSALAAVEAALNGQVDELADICQEERPPRREVLE
jgi:Kef-type K+ transport system membrane component KefB